jgi:hypothetical protein
MLVMRDLLFLQATLPETEDVLPPADGSVAVCHSFGYSNTCPGPSRAPDLLNSHDQTSRLEAVFNPLLTISPEFEFRHRQGHMYLGSISYSNFIRPVG